MVKSIQFNTQDLIPRAWANLKGPIRVFNPSLLRTKAGWIMAYRLVGDDQKRRIALCRLNEELNVIKDSLVAFSDYLKGCNRDWYADPRLYQSGDHLYIYWNTGWHEPRNFQYVQAIDPKTYLPISSLIEFNVKDNQNPLEKNWMLFGDALEYAVYSVNPHRILKTNLGKTESFMEDFHIKAWNNEPYESLYGKLRGGAPPQLVGDEYFSICHSVYGVEGNYTYSAACYSFSQKAPFSPKRKPRGFVPLPKLEGDRQYEKLNPAVGEVLYPCGAIFQNGLWYISYGINDESCAIAIIKHDDLLKYTECIA